MAEDLNQQEPTAEEKAKFEQDVLKAAEDAMKMEAEANKAGASDQGAGDAQEQPAENADAAAEQPADVAEQPAEPAAEQPAEPAAAPDPTAALKAALADANDRNLRLMAEFDNYRRRTAKEQLELIETANGKLLEKLSEVQDNFERAFASENKAQDLEAFEKGMQMIYNQFAKILTDAGLEQIDPTGAEFDPNMHEALMQQPSETVPEGHVVTVFQKGYKLKNKILKTAKVIVSSGK
ncbi:nucleotide exchange factor GrpE [Fibrobacter sp. UWR2]|uniref:nucleotide exchange factor GrpE n=1 Tax=Fibrobacter sp. UWR2 TaxID=1964352 RepID=UPI000B521D0A|nr:nucleotide exchange factor GrpE [Fibrobacter sp. UWR2]OWV00164.1 nucleotide exchange factor GrpE [Fibrobacter sp. UWR2]